MIRIVTVLDAQSHHEARSRAARFATSHQRRAPSVITALAEPSARRTADDGGSALSARPHSVPPRMAYRRFHRGADAGNGEASASHMWIRSSSIHPDTRARQPDVKKGAARV